VLIAFVLVVRGCFLYKLPKRCFVYLWIFVLARLLIPIKLPADISVYNFVTGSGGAATAQQAVPASAAESAAPPVFLIVALAGMAAMAAVFIVMYILSYRAFGVSEEIEDGYVAKWKKMCGDGRVAIKTSAAAQVPMCYGLVKRTILLPEDYAKWSKAELGYILSHEMIHIRNGDLVVKALMTAALCMNWYNPLVWVMYFVFNDDIELRCDEILTGKGKRHRVRYSMLLLKFAQDMPDIRAPIGFALSKTRKRVIAIKKAVKAPVAAVAAFLVIATFCTTALATNRTEADQVSVPAEAVAESVPGPEQSAAAEPESGVYDGIGSAGDEAYNAGSTYHAEVSASPESGEDKAVTPTEASQPSPEETTGSVREQGGNGEGESGTSGAADGETSPDGGSAQPAAGPQAAPPAESTSAPQVVENTPAPQPQTQQVDDVLEFGPDESNLWTGTTVSDP